VSLFRLPSDSGIDAATWTARHRLMVAVLLAQGVLLVLWMGLKGTISLAHGGVEVAPLIVLWVIARREGLPRRLSATAVTLGLFTESALVVHLSDGETAAHFHYFVMLCLLAQYEDPVPFLVGVGYVVLQHGIMGMLIPGGVYGEADEREHVWRRALVHGAFVLAASGALVAGWRANALVRISDRRNRREAEEYLDIAGALLLAVDGAGVIRMANRRFCEVLGRPEAELLGARFAEVAVEPEEREAHEEALHRLPAAGADRVSGVERRIVTAAGDVRVVEWELAIRRDEQGRVVDILCSGEDVTGHRAAAAQRALDQRQLVGLRRLAQDVAGNDDARQAVVDRTLELADADFAGLAEPDAGDTVLTITTATLEGMLGYEIPIEGDLVSGCRAAYLSGQAGFHADVEGSPRINPHMVAITGARSVTFEPVVIGGRPRAVLVVGWRRRVPGLDSRERDIVAIAADEAAVALQRLAALRRLEDAALTDALTDVPNRRAFDRQLPVEIARARREGRPLALAMMDVNEFKALNDREGHDAGDRLLRAATRAWADVLRTTDVLARFGGDEFAVLLPDCDAASAAIVAERLHAAIPHAAGCGVGIAVWDGEEDGDALMARADEALYEDKAAGARRRLGNPNRVAAVRATGLLDGEHSDELDEVTRVVRWLLDVPVALVSLVDDDRQVFAAQCGLDGWAADEGGTPLSHSFCQHAVITGRPLVIEDARRTPLVEDNLAIPELNVIAYAGMPLLGERGLVLGVLCAIDHKPRAWSQDDLATLARLAERARQELLRRSLVGQA
jgi:diguanylate cyclase (GGDEF)-like protein/PAS domain S-box-containing protein